MPGQLVFFALLFGAMYVLMVRPQQQRARRQRELIAALAVGDSVVTAGGMIGEIVSVDDERVTIRLAPGVDVTFLRGAIAQKVTDDGEPALGSSSEAPPDIVDLNHPDDDGHDLGDEHQ
jgi:preprotein translocase subunit YajC